MNTKHTGIGYSTRKKRGWYRIGAIAIAAVAAFGVGCLVDSGGSSGGDSGGSLTLDDPNPTVTLAGTTLYCADPNIQYADAATEDYVVDGPDSIPAFNLSKETAFRTSDQPSELRASAGNAVRRLWNPVLPMTGSEDGVPTPAVDWTGEPMVHPLIVSFTEQVLGTYELGDGSADIGDPFHIDDAFVSLSLDNGKSWKKERVGQTSDRSSIQVTWNGAVIDYPGHSHKMTVAAEGNNILAAWLDKYCPSGNPYDLAQDDSGSTIKWPDDLYQVNGNQGSVDYNLPCTVTDPDSLSFDCAFNLKPVYEVPYSCVWAARGVFDPATGIIAWRKEEQLTSGKRDANKIWIAHEDIGFAIAWQEDPEGLRSGKGEGPGDGWSGATTNHGADIWYSRITMVDFDDVIIDDQGDTDPSNDVVSDDPLDIAALTEKGKPAVHFDYPVRITDNAPCTPDNDSKLYCADVCTDSTLVESNNKSGDQITRCITGDHDPLEADTSIYTTLDGDTGASRPALAILKTDQLEYVAVLAYEETKGLSETEPGVPDDPTATDIAVEGKIVLAEAFLWDQPVTISAGNAVSQRVPRYDPLTGTFDSSDMIYENARRVVLITQVDPCEMTANSYPVGFLYKQSFETRGGPSDMYIRMVRGLTPDTFESTTVNVSAQSVIDPNATMDVDNITWSADNLDDYVGENPYDNTFSPRAFLRGDEIYTGFAYTPSDARTNSGNEASNFWIHRFVDDGTGLQWQGPQQLTFEQGGTSALDPRFIPTPEYNPDGIAAGITSDKSNPNVLLASYGTADSESELDVYYSRSTDKGKTWEYFVINDGGTPADTSDDQVRFHKISSWPLPVIEKEVQLVSSPDGTMGFNVWLQESTVVPTGADLDVDVDGDGTDDVTIPDNRLGLESWLGRVDWVDPATIVP